MTLFDPTRYDLRSPSLQRRVARLQELAGYYRTPHWQRFRWFILMHHGRVCQECHRVFPATELHVHHLTYRNLGHERIGDVTLLCIECHLRKHRRTYRRRGSTGPGR